MTNAGVNGYATTGGIPDGSIGAAKLAPGIAWGKLTSGFYYNCSSPNTTTTSTTTASTLRVGPWYVPNAVRLSRIGAEVTSAGDSGSLYRLGIYADNGSGYPGALLLDAGTIAGDSNTVQEITINLQLQPGLYWVGGAAQNISVTQPTMRGCNTTPPMQNLLLGASTPSSNLATLGFFHASVSGALPAVFTSTVNTSTTLARVFVKIA